MNSYILVTPARNEENNIEHLIKSIIDQSLKPKLWIIVNDNSTDSTAKIIKKFSKMHSWIKLLNNTEKSKYMGVNYSRVCIMGFDHAQKFAEQKELKYEYIGLLDADIDLPKEYFSELIQRMDNDKKLGITSGSIYSTTKNGLIIDSSRTDLPRGAARLWRKECFIETGGYRLTRAPDSVSNIKAKLLGWEIKQFLDIKTIQTRETSSGIGLWKGYLEKGENSYILNLNPILVLLKAINFTFKKPYYLGIPFSIGYLKGFIHKSKKIDDEDVKNYYRHFQLNLALDSLLKK